MKRQNLVIKYLVFGALGFSCVSCSSTIPENDIVQETLNQTKGEVANGETGQGSSGESDKNEARSDVKAEEESVVTDDMNAKVIRSKEDVDALVVKYIKAKKAGEAFEPVHVIVPVKTADDFGKARTYLGNLVGIASPFEVQIMNEITSAVDFSLNVKSSVPLHIIVSGKSADEVKLGHVSLKLSGDVVEVRRLSWRSIQEGHSLIKILDSREVIFDDVVFDEVKANDLPLPADAMIVVGGSEVSEIKDATFTIRNSVFRNVNERVGLTFSDEAREAYSKVTFDNVTFENASFSSSGLDVSVRESVLVHQCRLKGISASAVFCQFDNRASVTIEDSELSGHVYRYDPPQAQKEQRKPEIVYKNNKVSDDATAAVGYGVSWEKITSD